MWIIFKRNQKLFYLPFIMEEVDSLIINLEHYYFGSSFIMKEINLEYYFELSFIMTNMDNVDVNLGVILNHLLVDEC